MEVIFRVGIAILLLNLDDLRCLDMEETIQVISALVYMSTRCPSFLSFGNWRQSILCCCTASMEQAADGAETAAIDGLVLS